MKTEQKDLFPEQSIPSWVTPTCLLYKMTALQQFQGGIHDSLWIFEIFKLVFHFFIVWFKAGLSCVIYGQLKTTLMGTHRDLWHVQHVQ